MAPLTDEEWAELARDLARRVEAVAPGWTDHNDADPGMTMAELTAFLAESLLTRPGRGRSRRALTRLGDVVKDLDPPAGSPCRELVPLTRTRYFHGRLLAAADFELEQRYARDKQRRHNLVLHGSGIVRGLQLTLETGPDHEPVVAVSPGVAIGPDGEELVVCETMTRELTPGQAPGLVVLRLVDRLVEIVPSPDGDEASRIEEVVELDVLPEAARGDLVVGRLERTDGAWRRDMTYEPERVER